MTDNTENPCVLFVTPEVTYLPSGMGNISDYLSAKAGGVADVSAALITALFEQGADVHVALPDYRKIFHQKLSPTIRRDFNIIKNRMPEDRVHLAQDRGFFYLDRISYGDGSENAKIALLFQREIINNIVPSVQPDLIHCNDWMTGLIPAMSRKLDIPCLFTIHNIYTVKCPLSYIEDIGIDTAFFWQNLFFEHFPLSYEESRDSNPVDFLSSGVFGAHYVNTVSPTFLNELIDNGHNWVDKQLKQQLAYKKEAGCATGILNGPEPSFNPITDKALFRKYNAKNHYSGKQYDKLFLQEKLGLIMDSGAPLFFWPSRLDTFQKGCQLMAEILYDVVRSYWNQNLEIIFVANGDFKRHFKDIVKFHNLENRVAVCDFDEQLARQAYAASDFVVMPSRFEPCGLPQMIGSLYGALPVVHDIGGLHDTVTPMDANENTGNGFLFKNYDAGSLFNAIKKAMRFYDLSQKERNQQVERVMAQGLATYNPAITATQYIELYEKMLERSLITL